MRTRARRHRAAARHRMSGSARTARTLVSCLLDLDFLIVSDVCLTTPPQMLSAVDIIKGLPARACGGSIL